MPAVCYSATVLCPMSGPPLGDGGVLVADGNIVAVGPAADLATRADRRHHVDGVLLPGLVNGHVQLEHHDAAHLARPGPFHLWLRAVLGTTRQWSPERWGRSAQRGVLRALRSGSTTVVDWVVKGPGVPAAARAGLTGPSLVEIAYVDAAEQDGVLAALRHSLALPARQRTVGIAAHAPYSLGSGVLQALAALAAEQAVPLHIRAAETNAEVAAIRTGEGPLVTLAQDLRCDFEWLDGGVGAGPVGYLEQVGALRAGTALVHGVWVDLRDARTLAAAGVPVVCCPRANAVLGTGDAPLERFAEAGTRLALGTGSPAAAGADCDLLDAAAAWVDLAQRRDLVYWPSAAGMVGLEEQAIRLVTSEGARALGLGRHSGVLEPGRRADLVGVGLPDTSAATVYTDLVRRGAGAQVLTVLGGVRKARRADPSEPWPAVEEHKDL